jgi:hypothetical protein
VVVVTAVVWEIFSAAAVWEIFSAAAVRVGVVVVAVVGAVAGVVWGLTHFLVLVLHFETRLTVEKIA